MRSSGRSPVPYTLALGVVGMVYLGGPTGDRPLAPVSLPPKAAQLLAGSSGPSCPLPVGQQVKAVKAFREMWPVFRHPRCLNCHGGVDPFADDKVTRHEGGQMEKAFPVDLEQCQACHDGLPGWMVPPREDLLFVGKSDEELCRQMKHHEKTGNDFVGHIFNDHDATNVQFIAAGFKGDRALGDVAAAEPPPGTQAELTEKARKWVKILGDGYTASPECGCVMPKFKLEVHHTEVIEVPKGLPSKEESEAKFEVNLEPMGDDKPGLFAGQHSLKREIKMTLPPKCTGKASREERWHLHAMVDSVTGDLRVWRMAIDDEPTSKIECPHGPGKFTTGLFPRTATMLLGYGELVLPADSGSSKRFEAQDGGERESLTITVLEVPASE